ncbi:trichohyalin-like [Odontomachus brunneus]|uniref:trichohyalin-like n=1 Tax=Odontomachus brunneus TaxID=486640 RepID=UPI0013F2618A|nr:trichohyalin-like [Odontomachus brunneus]
MPLDERCPLVLQERVGPVGNSGLRRPSRSPRSQRSRSADVDCLKKYTERRVEERRYTEISDASKLDTSKWMPLPRNLPRGQQMSPSSNKRPSRDERQDSVEESATGIERWPAKPNSADTSSEDLRSSVIRIDHELTVPRPPGTRSHSTDVTALRGHDKRSIEQRRHTDCSDPRTIATRWIPQINGAKFRRESSPLARVDCEVTKGSANRWMTFAKNSSPDPVLKVNPERKDSTMERKEDEGPCKDLDNSKWQPPRKFSPAKSEKGHLQRQDELDMGRDRSASCVDANDRANKLSQRMRDLYDFKTENEWPKRAGSSQRENVWISKSSSEEERTNYQPVRRNSQDLEFNDRMSRFKVEHEEDRRRAKGNHDEVFMDQQEERLRKFNDKLRYSEDLGTGRTRGRERRTYSDDYDEKARRESRMSRQLELTIKRDRSEVPTKKVEKENKRNSDVSARSRDSRVSYVEVDFSKRETRASDASYASVNFTKRGSVECKSTRKILDVPPRRAFSQSDERPATPVPPIEWNDEHYVPKKLPSERQKRDSTRYKVYLT